MRKNEGREAAHVKSRVKDLSKVPNLIDFVGLFCCITPIAPSDPDTEGLYEPVLIRDTESLIHTFGDPRIDPEKYIDLYTVYQIVNSGSSCYIAKVPSGDTATFSMFSKKSEASDIKTVAGSLDSERKVWTSTETFDVKEIPVSVKSVVGAGDPTELFNYTLSWDSDNKIKLTFSEALDSGATVTCELVKEPENIKAFAKATAALTDSINVKMSVTQAKPYANKLYFLNVNLLLKGSTLLSCKVPLKSTTTNKSLIDAINSLLGSYLTLELDPELSPNAFEDDAELKEQSIVKMILDQVAPVEESGSRSNVTSETALIPCKPLTKASFDVTVGSYTKALSLFKDKQFTGCIMSDLTAPVTGTDGFLKEIDGEDRRGLQAVIKEVAAERRDVTALFSTPNITDINDACEWVSATGTHTDLWEYGTENTTAYSEQSFYLEMYYSWLNQKCTKLVNGVPTGTLVVPTAPAGIVIKNVLQSFKDRNPWFPVAGDQGGIIDGNCTVIKNPALKLDRDKLVSYRINPIYDTGTRGVQIYGNETLNAGYTDLNAAHIARTLVHIRSRVDEYTETCKFMLNNERTWSQWKNYVTTKILEPIQAGQGINTFEVKMGLDTTTPTEIANRIVKGQISLTFFQSAEIFDLTFEVDSSASAFEA